MAAIDEQLSSPLFGLPLEVRARIYDFYLTFDDGHFAYTKRPRFVYLESGDYATPLPALFATCRRAYHELRRQAHHQAVLRVYIPERSPSIGMAVHGTLKFDRLERLYLIVAMEHPYWNRWLPFFEEVTKLAPHLRELVIDWAPRPLRLTGRDKATHEKKEGQFLEIVRGLAALRIVRLHGGDVPEEWAQKLAEGEEGEEGRRVVRYKTRWWKEPGGDW